MPQESRDLYDLAGPFDVCPECFTVILEPFIRGTVQRSKRFLGFLWKRDYCAVICPDCKRVIGWESPPGWRD